MEEHVLTPGDADGGRPTHLQAIVGRFPFTRAVKQPLLPRARQGRLLVSCFGDEIMKYEEN